MGKVTELFGNIVENSVSVNPQRAASLLRAAYTANGLQKRFLPEGHLLAHQRYVAVMDNQAITRPLRNPDQSAIVNLFFPCELLHALDISPQFTEGLSCYLNGAKCEQVFIQQAEASGVPPTYCSYHKILLGAVYSGVLPKPRFVASTSLACDANMTTFRSIAETYQVPHFMIDVPGRYCEDAVRYVAGQLSTLAEDLQSLTGSRLDEETLREVIRRENRSLALYRKHFQLLADRYIPTDVTSEMYKIFPTHILLGTPEAETYFKLLYQDTQAAEKSAGEKRILWVHTIPYWQRFLREQFNHVPGRQLLCCDLNFDFTEPLDESRPYRSMAKRLLKNSLNGPLENRTNKMLEMAKHLRADGVVFFCHWGCKQTLGGVSLARNLLQQEGFPVLMLDGDGCDRNNANEGQMSTQLQAFLEMLEGNQ